MSKKMLSILLAIVLLSGCASEEVSKEEVQKYLEYLDASNVGVLQMDGDRFTDESMLQYAFLTLAQEEDYIPEEGLSKEELSAFCEQYFGIAPAFKESYLFQIDDEQIISNGWDYVSDSYYILTEKEEKKDGTICAEFDLYNRFTEQSDEEYRKQLINGETKTEKIDSIEMLLSEHTDENGEFYVQYHSVRVVE